MDEWDMLVIFVRMFDAALLSIYVAFFFVS
jgi:hypothetical protein